MVEARTIAGPCRSAGQRRRWCPRISASTLTTYFTSVLSRKNLDIAITFQSCKLRWASIWQIYLGAGDNVHLTWALDGFERTSFEKWRYVLQKASGRSHLQRPSDLKAGAGDSISVCAPGWINAAIILLGGATSWINLASSHVVSPNPLDFPQYSIGADSSNFLSFEEWMRTRVRIEKGCPANFKLKPKILWLFFFKMTSIYFFEEVKYKKQI